MKFRWNNLRYHDESDYLVQKLANLGEYQELKLEEFKYTLPLNSKRRMSLSNLLTIIQEIDTCRINIQQIMIDLCDGKDTVVEDVHLVQINIKDAKEGMITGDDKLKFEQVLKYYSINYQFLSALHSSLEDAVAGVSPLPTLLERRARLWVEPINLIKEGRGKEFKKINIPLITQ